MHQPTLLGGWLSAHTKEGGNGSGDKSEEWNAFEALFYNKNKLFISGKVVLQSLSLFLVFVCIGSWQRMQRSLRFRQTSRGRGATVA
jgi:hypothetical protein